MRIILPSILVKIALALIPLFLLKTLSSSLTPESFSNFFILFNISLYLSAFIFSLPAISTLRFYHHEPFNALTKFTSNIFLFSIYLFFTLLIVLYVINIFLESFDLKNILPIFLLSSGLGYFLFISNVYRSNQYLYSLAIFHFLLLFLISSIFYFAQGALRPIELIFILGCVYWLISIILRLWLVKQHAIVFSIKTLFFNGPTRKNIFFIYAFPLAIVGLTNSFIASSNQIILKFFISDIELAGYISSYIIAEKIFFAIQSLIVFIFLPIIYKKYDSLNVKAIKFIRNLSFCYFILGVIICIFTLFYKEILVSTISSSAYIDFAWIIPLIGIGLIFLGVASILVEIYLVSKNSMIVMKIYLAGAAINFVLNLVLIPLLGINGAIIATIVSYIAILVIAILNLKLVTNINIATLRSM